jgi:hypothetical protein
VKLRSNVHPATETTVARHRNQRFPVVNPLQAGVMRRAGFGACWAHGKDRGYGSGNVQAKAAATCSVDQGGSEPT